MGNNREWMSQMNELRNCDQRQWISVPETSVLNPHVPEIWDIGFA